MRRFGALMLCGAIAGFAAGCGGEDQPNAPTAPEQINEDFLKNTSDMMKKANSGMSKKAQQEAKAKAGETPAPAPGE